MSLNDFDFDHKKPIRRIAPVLKKDIRDCPLEGVILEGLSKSSSTQCLIPKIYLVRSGVVWMENVRWTLGEFLLDLEKPQQSKIFRFVVEKLIEIFFVFKNFGIIHGDLCTVGSILRNIVVDPVSKKFYIVDFDRCFCVHDTPTPEFDSIFDKVLAELKTLLDTIPIISSFNCRGSLSKISFCDFESIGN